MSIKPVLFSLPIEIIEYILRYLSPRQIEVSRRVCLVFFEVIQTSQFLKEQLNRSFLGSWASLWKKIEILSLQENLHPSILKSVNILKDKLGKAKSLEIIRVKIIKEIVQVLCSQKQIYTTEQASNNLENNFLLKILAKPQEEEGRDVDEVESMDREARSTYILHICKWLLVEENMEAVAKLTTTEPSLTFLFSHVLAAKARSMQEAVPEKLKALERKAASLTNIAERNLVYSSIMLKFGESGNLSKVVEMMFNVNHLDRPWLLAKALKSAVENDFFSEVHDFLYTDQTALYQGQDEVAVYEPGEMLGLLEDAFAEHIVLEALALSALKNGNRDKAEEIAIKIKDPVSLSIVLSRMFPLVADKTCLNEIDRLLADQNVDTKSYVLRALAQNAKNEGYEEILKMFSNFLTPNSYKVHLDWARVLTLKKKNAKAAREVLALIQGDELQEEAHLELLKFQVEKGFLEEAKESSTFLKGFQYVEGVKVIYQEELKQGSFNSAKTTVLLLEQLPDPLPYTFALESIAEAEMAAQRFYQAKDTIRSIADPVGRKRAFVSFVEHALEVRKKELNSSS